MIMNKFILLKYESYKDWECIDMFDWEQGAIDAMEKRLNDDYDEAFGWKWECYATIEGNKVIHSESKDVWSEFKIVKIELPKIEE